VFMMTIAGILALVMGSGYLLQYTFTNILGDIAKMLLMFLGSLGVIGYGAWLASKREDQQEFASAILGLGVTLCYLCSYFAGSYYQLLESGPELFLFSVVTAGGILLAYLYETRIVAVVSLVGASLSPLVIGSTLFGGEHYFIIQLLISIAYIHLSQRIRWVVLANLNFVVITIAFQSHLYAASGMGIVTLFGLHGFFYLFNYYLLISRISKRGLVERVDIALVTSNALFFAIALWQAMADTTLLGLLLGANAVILIFLFESGRRLVIGKDSGMQVR